MNSFRNYRQVVPAGRCCPSGGCAVCCSQPAQLRQQFDDVVRRSWSLVEIDRLSKAARSALL
jgi:hypothetical protein